MSDPSDGVETPMEATSSSPSPTRSRGGPRQSGSGNGNERPRFFDTKAKAICWAKADTVPGRHPERWRKDAAGNVVCKRFCNCQGCLCFEYDHIVPFSKGKFDLLLFASSRLMVSEFDMGNFAVTVAFSLWIAVNLWLSFGCHEIRRRRIHGG